MKKSFGQYFKQYFRQYFWEILTVYIILWSFLFVSAADAPESSKTAPEVSERNVQCLTQALYFEARGESDRGILAVGHVIMNRVQAKGFPESICGVVHEQKVKGVYQFSYLSKKNLRYEGREYQRIQYLALRALEQRKKGIDIVDGSLYYYSYSVVTPRWSKFFKCELTVGRHKFCKI